MIATEKPKRLVAQACPLCSEKQDVIIQGHVPNENDPSLVTVIQEKGYSFCNCRNIFFTDWSNIEQGTYDPNYYKKYASEHIDNLMTNMAMNFYQTIKRTAPATTQPSILEIGAINPSIMNFFKLNGFSTLGLDICDHPFGDHKLAVGNFEDLKIENKFDVIWASHVFEHFKDPIEAIRKCNDILNPGGVLFIAMPDPYFIDFKNPYLWGHWHLKEHHILWDMESFSDVLRENGFEIIETNRNTGIEQICVLDYSIIAKKIYPMESYDV